MTVPTLLTSPALLHCVLRSRGEVVLHEPLSLCGRHTGTVDNIMQLFVCDKKFVCEAGIIPFMMMLCTSCRHMAICCLLMEPSTWWRATWC
jgi:hypothetical protein